MGWIRVAPHGRASLRDCASRDAGRWFSGVASLAREALQNLHEAGRRGRQRTPRRAVDADLAALVSGSALPDRGPRGETLRDDDFLLLLNAHHDAIPFQLPPSAAPWRVLLDTTTDDGAGEAGKLEGATYALPSRSLVLLGRENTGASE